jgi:hypothetical protein
LNPVANLDDAFGFAGAAGKHKPWFVRHWLGLPVVSATSPR